MVLCLRHRVSYIRCTTVLQVNKGRSFRLIPDQAFLSTLKSWPNKTLIFRNSVEMLNIHSSDCWDVRITNRTSIPNGQCHFCILKGDLYTWNIRRPLSTGSTVQVTPDLYESLHISGTRTLHALFCRLIAKKGREVPLQASSNSHWFLLAAHQLSCSEFCIHLWGNQSAHADVVLVLRNLV